MNINKHHEGWELWESGPAGADHAVLLLAGALVTAAYYDDVLAERRVKEGSVRFVAATLPGHSGTQPLDDLSMDNYARLAGMLAADLGCDAVVGHSPGRQRGNRDARRGPLLRAAGSACAELLTRGRVQVSARA